jgi:serine phosphatase RsbU (regulator of sigma subunit)
MYTLKFISVFKSFNGSMVISAVIFMIEDETGKAFYINAEHPYSVLYRDGKASFIEEGIQLPKDLVLILM